MSMPSSSSLFSGQQLRTVGYQVNGKGDSVTKDNMLSMNFSTPLTGQARAERINQMMNSHVSLSTAHRYRTQPVCVAPDHSANVVVMISLPLRSLG